MPKNNKIIRALAFSAALFLLFSFALPALAEDTTGAGSANGGTGGTTGDAEGGASTTGGDARPPKGSTNQGGIPVNNVGEVKYEAEKKFIVPIPGLGGTNLPGEQNNVPLIGDYINSVYKFSIGIGALLAMAVIVWAGIRYITETGKPFAQSEAKTWIISAVMGLILLISAGLILTTLNSNLTNLSGADSIIKGIRDKETAREREYFAERERQIQERQALVDAYKAALPLREAARKAIAQAQNDSSLTPEQIQQITDENTAILDATQDAINQVRGNPEYNKRFTGTTDEFKRAYNYSNTPPSFASAWEGGYADELKAIGLWKEEEIVYVQTPPFLDSDAERAAAALILIEHRSYIYNNPLGRLGYTEARTQIFSENASVEAAYNQLISDYGISYGGVQ